MMALIGDLRFGNPSVCLHFALQVRNCYGTSAYTKS